MRPKYRAAADSIRVGEADGVSLIRTPRLSCASDERSRNFFGEDLEAGEGARAERGHDRDVGSVAPACHQDAADARLIVTGIECVPAASEIGLEPCAEIHGRRIASHPDVTQIAGAVARRNIHATAEGD